MTDLFDITGDNLEVGFENLKAAASPIEQQLHELLQQMWIRYEPYADPDFRHGFARDVDARFWEMYLGCTLLDAGHTLLPVSDRRREGGQPDLCVLENERRTWIEAIAPGLGEPGPDRIVPPVPLNEGVELFAIPMREAQLRTSGAFWTKAQKIGSYLKAGVIAPEDRRIIAISGSRFGVYIPDAPLPLIMTTLFPISDPFIVIDRETEEVIEEGFHPAPAIPRAAGDIPRTAFLDARFADISGVIWSQVAIGALSRDARPVTFVHNPLAQAAAPEKWVPWDREFVLTPNGEAWTGRDILKAAEPAEAEAGAGA